MEKSKENEVRVEASHPCSPLGSHVGEKGLVLVIPYYETGKEERGETKVQAGLQSHLLI